MTRWNDHESAGSGMFLVGAVAVSGGERAVANATPDAPAVAEPEQKKPGAPPMAERTPMAPPNAAPDSGGGEPPPDVPLLLELDETEFTVETGVDGGADTGSPNRDRYGNRAPARSVRAP